MVDFLTSLHAYSDWGLLLLRLCIGIIFIVHARGKLANINSFMGFIGVCEMLGGLALIFGFLTQLAALGLAIIMAGAAYKKHFEWKVPFFTLEKMGWEYDFVLFGANILLFLVGSGEIAVDPALFGL